MYVKNAISEHCMKSLIRPNLKIQIDACFGSRATDEGEPLGRRIKGIPRIFNFTVNDAAFAAMTDAGAAGPLHWHVAGFRKFKQAAETRIPRYGKAAENKGDDRT